MEDELQAYLKATAKQLLTAACTDQVQVGLLQSAGRRYGLTGGALDDFVVALARTLISDGVVPAEFVASEGWRPWTGSVEERIERIRLLQIESPQDGFFVWFMIAA